MIKFNSLSSAIALAEFAHRTQLDKAGLPYIDHPRRVLAKVQAQGALPYVQQAAILHDVCEDTAITHDMLLGMGFSEAVVQITRLLDRNHSEAEYRKQVHAVMSSVSGKWWTGTEYVTQDQIPDKDEFYYAKIKEHPSAKMVKLADIEDNLSPWRLSYLTPKTQEHYVMKYEKARRLLA